MNRPLAPAAWVSAGLAASAAAFAQEPVAGERIEITGSRLAYEQVESASPIAVITAEDIRSEGYQSLELILNNFPQLVGAQGSRVSNGTTGTATANLRGLFAERTLVLVNGRRMPAGSPYILAADLNQIPVHLISRIEILTGGASAVYGSDAIAGVVNIILDDRFEGVRGDLSYDFYNHRQKSDYVSQRARARGYEVPPDKARDGATTAASLTLGSGFAGGRGNATLSLRHARSDALLQSERDYSACALTAFGSGADADVFCGGSVTGFPGRFVDLGTLRLLTVADASGGVRPWSGAVDAYNFSPFNYYQRPVERHGANAFVHFDVSASARAYAESSFTRDHTVAQLAPTGLFGGITRIRYENPLLSESWRSQLSFTNPDGTPGSGPGTTAAVVIQRRNVEGGGRRNDIRHTSYRNALGMKGDLPRGWAYDLHAQYSKVSLRQQSLRDFSLTRAARALDVVPDPATGAAVCASVVDGTDPACVPYDVWRLGGVTTAALEYLHAPGSQRGFTSQQVLSGSVRGDLGEHGVQLPRATEPVELALGLERRADELDFQPDDAFISGDLASGATTVPPVGGRVTVNELFAEARVPVLDTLALTGSYRHSRYGTGRNTDTFGVGFNAAPARFARLRGSYQRAIRAANIIELFTPQVRGFFGAGLLSDPCAGTSPARSLEECRRTGVSPAQYGRIEPRPPGVGFPALYGGNPQLSPEKADTVTLGLAITPARDLAVTMDYFDIRIDDFINPGTPEVTLQRCLDSGDPLFCDLIMRDPALGTLWLDPARVLATNQNIGRVRVTGTDLALNYRRPLASGHRLSLAAIGTYLQRFSLEPYKGAKAYQCAGTFLANCVDPRPRWRHRLRVGWRTPWHFEASAAWRYIRSMHNPDPEAVIRELPAMSYLDLDLTWNLGKRLVLGMGVSNVADRDPPLIADNSGGTINGNTFAQSYDALGRHVFVRLTARF